MVGAGISLFEADDLNHVEENGTDGVGSFCVNILKTFAEGCVAVAMRSERYHIHALALVSSIQSGLFYLKN